MIMSDSLLTESNLDVRALGTCVQCVLHTKKPSQSLESQGHHLQKNLLLESCFLDHMKGNRIMVFSCIYSAYTCTCCATTGIHYIFFQHSNTHTGTDTKFTPYQSSSYLLDWIKGKGTYF